MPLQAATLGPEDGSVFAKQAREALEARRAELKLSKLTTGLLADFMVAAEDHKLSPADKERILDQATLMFQNIYAHLPFKLERFRFIHPVRWLDDNVRPFLDSISETDFHGHVIAAFSLVRDAHTLYGLPQPYRGVVAFLPFLMRYFNDPVEGRRYVVTKVMTGFDHEHFRSGAEILTWRGFPVDNYVAAIAGRLSGGNDAATFTRGAFHSTLRPLTFCQPPEPDEFDTVFEYRAPNSSVKRSIQIPWGVISGAGSAGRLAGRAFSLSALSAEASSYCAKLHNWPSAPNAPVLPNPSKLPDVFDYQFTGDARKIGAIDLANLVSNDASRADARLGYLKIRQFGGSGLPSATDTMVRECRRILEVLDREAPDGLIIDLRGNPGGEIRAAERMLQMLTPHRIEPALFHLANTPAMVRTLKNIGALPPKRRGLDRGAAELKPWLQDAENVPAPDGGPLLTSGQTLTDPDAANGIGQVYQGPVALLIDGMTYSAAEIFAAGFEDHAIGPVLSTDSNSGGGGANVWGYQEAIRNLVPHSGLALEKLPLDASMSVAIRRSSRVGLFPGKAVEDDGLEVKDPFHCGSAEEAIADYPGLLRQACDALVKVPQRRIDVSSFEVHLDGSVTVVLQTKGISFVVFLIDGTEVLAVPVQQEPFPVPAVPGRLRPMRLRIEGFIELSGPHELLKVVVRTLDLQPVRVVRAVSPADGIDEDTEEF